MRVAHILPPRVLSDSLELDGYALLLPRLIREKQYRDFYRDRSGIKIIDNGIAEGATTPFSTQLYYARLTGCAEVVLPDVMGSMDATLRATAQVFYDAYQERQRHKFMIVAQGTTVLDCISTVDRALNMFPGLISSIGIPRHILSEGIDARLRIAQHIRDLSPNRPIHLLGTHPDFPAELQCYKHYYHNLGVRGVDTSLAWNATRQGVLLKDPNSLNDNISIKRQPIEEFAIATPTDVNMVLLKNNIDAIDEWVRV